MYASPDDEATAHLLVVAAFHEAAAKAEEEGDLSILRFSQAVLRHFDEYGELQGRLYDVVRGYAEKHAPSRNRPLWTGGSRRRRATDVRDARGDQTVWLQIMFLPRTERRERSRGCVAR